MRLVLFAVALAGCGRVAFDDIPTTRDGDGGIDALLVAPDASPGWSFSYIKPSNTEAFDQFGYAIAVSADGTTLAVGAPLEDDDLNATSQGGAVYVYVRTASTWSQQAILRASDAAPDDYFGSSVTISSNGNVVAVGAPAEDSGTSVPTDTSATDAGAVYVFRRAGTTWSQDAYLKSGNIGAGDEFGYSVSLSGAGDLLAVGAPFNDGADGLAADTGLVDVFAFSGSWLHQVTMRVGGPDPGDNTGHAVAFSNDGQRLAFGVPGEDSATAIINGSQNDNSVESAGAAFVYRQSGPWELEAYIKASTPAFGDSFGRSLAFSSDSATLAISAMGDDSVVANSGAVFTFTRSGTTWSELAKLKGPSPGDNDQFGYSLALAPDASVLYVGTALDDDPGLNAGTVTAFDRASPWSLGATPLARMPDAGDELGNGVALSADGRVRAIAVHFDDSSATGINGDPDDDAATDSGAVIVATFD